MEAKSKSKSSEWFAKLRFLCTGERPYRSTETNEIEIFRELHQLLHRVFVMAAAAAGPPPPPTMVGGANAALKQAYNGYNDHRDSAKSSRRASLVQR